VSDVAFDTLAAAADLDTEAAAVTP